VDPRSKRNNRKLGLQLMECMNNDPMIKRQYTNWLDKKEENEVKQLKFSKQSSLNGKRDLQLRLQQVKSLLQPEWLMSSQEPETQRNLQLLITDLNRISQSVDSADSKDQVPSKPTIPNEPVKKKVPHLSQSKKHLILDVDAEEEERLLLENGLISTRRSQN
jgi:hypothetical protein